jgi:RNA polymerase sigma-B factor
VLLDAFGALDEREREMVTLRFFDELLQREIAGRFGISQMQVSRILTRSLEKMREYLEAGELDNAELVDAGAELALAA